MGKGLKELRYLEGNYSQGYLGRRAIEVGQDVVQAMELEEEALSLSKLMEENRKKNEEEQYVVEGTILTCTACTAEPVVPFEKEFTAPEESGEIKLKVTVGERIWDGLRIATVRDSEKGINIDFFGNCMNLPDRVEEVERIKEAEKSEEKRRQGTCRLLMNLEPEWENVLRDKGYGADSNFQFNGIEEITMEAFLFCRHGGFIYPKSLGYVPTEKDGIPYGTELSEEEIEQLLEDYFRIMEWEEQDCVYLAKIMKMADMDTRMSIEFFLLTCDHESGKGSILKQKGGEGRGYIQIDDTAVKDKIKFWMDMYIQVNEWREENGKEKINLSMDGEKLSQSGIADFKKMLEEKAGVGWEASIYYWSQQPIPEGYTISLDDYVAKYECGDGKNYTKEGLYYATQCFVNGANTGKVVGKVREGTAEYTIEIYKGKGIPHYQLVEEGAADAERELPLAPVGSVGRARVYHEYYGGDIYVWEFSEEIKKQWYTISS